MSSKNHHRRSSSSLGSKSRTSSAMSHRICMVSDFFYPNMGGVETHIWCLAQCLMQRGHKVIVITHAYEGRQGVRYMTNGLKVYYLPITVIYDQVIMPTLYAFFPIFRNILIRERISIVHGHQSTSTLTNECILYARAMGYKICYTDHSLFGFSDLASISINKMLQIMLSDIDQVICVSNTCRENLVLRASLHPAYVSTIPNAVDPTKFTPDPSMRLPANTINVVVLSRLVYRKGIDLLVKIIPLVCSKVTNVHFIIGGDGPKMLLLEEMREMYQLHDKIELLGEVPYHKVRDVLVRGHIFLNCSLTESFCIALLEAASCGLFVVSTKVGGVPEVLPQSMIKFAEPNIEDLAASLIGAISVSRRINPYEFHERITSMYNWLEVAKRTETVYNTLQTRPKATFATRLLRYSSSGIFSGVIACVLITFLHLLSKTCEFVWPADQIERCPDIVLGSESSSVATLRLRTKKPNGGSTSSHSSRSSSSSSSTINGSSGLNDSTGTGVRSGSGLSAAHSRTRSTVLPPK